MHVRAWIARMISFPRSFSNGYRERAPPREWRSATKKLSPPSTNITGWQAGQIMGSPCLRPWNVLTLPGQCNHKYEGAKVVEYKLFIDGQWVEGGSALEVKNKYSGELIGMVPTARRDDVDAAIAAAEGAEDTM